MFRFVFRVLFAAVGLYLAARFVPGISADGWTTLLIAGLLLGVVNAVVKPIVVILTFPITIITLGLFLLVVNGAMLWLVAWFSTAWWSRGWSRGSSARSSSAWSAGSARC
jgi:putative membrane protein